MSKKPDGGGGGGGEPSGVVVRGVFDVLLGGMRESVP